MKRVEQRRWSPTDKLGDCFSACVASLLEIPLADVPVWSGSPDHAEGTWMHAVNDWLRLRGYCLVVFKDENLGAPAPECFHIASGPSPGRTDGLTHAVVAYGDRIIHDPNHQQLGITEITHRWFLVPTDWDHELMPTADPARYRWWLDPITVCGLGGILVSVVIIVALIRSML